MVSRLGNWKKVKFHTGVGGGGKERKGYHLTWKYENFKDVKAFWFFTFPCQVIHEKWFKVNRSCRSATYLAISGHLELAIFSYLAIYLQSINYHWNIMPYCHTAQCIRTLPLEQQTSKTCRRCPAILVRGLTNVKWSN